MIAGYKLAMLQEHNSISVCYIYCFDFTDIPFRKFRQIKKTLKTFIYT